MHTTFWSENLTGRELARLRRTWEDNIRLDLVEIGWKDVDLIQLNQKRDQ